jgi:hypothetical protein
MSPIGLAGISRISSALTDYVERRVAESTRQQKKFRTSPPAGPTSTTIAAKNLPDVIPAEAGIQLHSALESCNDERW